MRVPLASLGSKAAVGQSWNSQKIVHKTSLTSGWVSSYMTICTGLYKEIQISALTVTPSGQGKSVTLSKCHCNHKDFVSNLGNGKCQICHCNQIVTVSGEVCIDHP